MDSKAEGAALADIERRLSTVDNTPFGEKDWNHVVKECSSLSAKWEDLSIYLGLSANTIGTIKRDNPGNTRGCWNQALLEWIKQSYNTSEHGEPSWRTLLRAVAEEDRLSFKKLSQKHQAHAPLAPLAPSGSKEFTYPFLNVKDMNEDEKAVLKVQLNEAYENITGQYNTLTQVIISSLSDQGVTPKKLSSKLMNLNTFTKKKANLPLLQDRLDEIRTQETVEDAFYLLRSYGSFFDCYILRHIVNHLGTKSDRDKLVQYERELRKYCQRSIFECPRFSSSGSHHADLVMKVDEIVLESHSLNALDKLRVSLTKVLSLENHTLLLHTVEKGCIKLTFQVPHFAVDVIFSLTDEQMEDLKRLGVTMLSCNHRSLDLSTRQQPKPLKKMASAASSDSEEKHQYHKPRKRNIVSHSPLSKTDECGWFKLLGACHYGDGCQFQHVEPSSKPVFGFMPIPKGRPKLNRPCLSPDNKFYIVMQEDQIVMSFGKVSIQEKPDTTEEVGMDDEASAKYTSSVHQQPTEASSERLLPKKVKVVAEDSATLEYAKTVLTKSLSTHGQTKRSKYVYIHPEGVEEPDLYLTFVKSAAIKNTHELFKEKLPSEDGARKKLTVENVASLTGTSPTSISSAVYPKHKNQSGPLVQVRRDYAQDIREKMREYLTPSSGTPKLQARFGRIVYQKKIHDDRFDAGMLVQFVTETNAFQGSTFVPEINCDDVDALKKSLLTQTPSESETYTVMLKAGRDQVKVDIEFKPDGSPDVISISSKGPVELLFDVVCLHRKHDMRLKLSKIEKPSVEQSSIQGFISPTLTRSESGDMIYSPSLKYRWAVTYIRLQKTEQYKYQDSKYVVEISTVGEHQIKEQDCRHVIRYQDLKLHQEISVSSPSWDLSATPSSWSPDAIMEDFEEGGFLKMMDELNQTLQLGELIPLSA